MNPQERQLLAGFLQQLAQTRADPKDAEADRLIRDAVARQPDAGYLLVQRAMGLDLALKAAQAQAEKLQAQIDQPKRANEASFAGNAGAWGRAAPAAGAAALPQGAGTSLPPAAAGAAPSAWGSGMLSNLAMTAAGVVAGSFLYQGIQQMMGHHTSGASASKDTLTDDEIADAIDEPDDSLATNDGGLDSPDLG